MPPVSMSLNAHGARLDAESETLLPTTGGVFDVAHALRGEGFDASEDGTGRGTPILPVAIQERALAQNVNSGPDGAGVRDDGAAYTLEARSTPQAVSFRTTGNDGAYETGDRIDALTTATDRNSHVLVFDTTQVTSPQNFSAPKAGDPCHPLAAGQHPPAVAFAQNQRGELRTSTVSPQLTTGGGKPREGYPAVAFDLRGRDGGAMPEGPHETANLRAASGGSSRSYVAQPWAVRRLTPRECDRLQGFTDDFTDIPWRGKETSPDGRRYKALGNSMAVNVMSLIGERIALVDAL